MENGYDDDCLLFLFLSCTLFNCRVWENKTKKSYAFSVIIFDTLPSVVLKADNDLRRRLCMEYIRDGKFFLLQQKNFSSVTQLPSY